MTIAFIPARCGSKSIPMKNIKPLCGKPLIYWNLEALEHAEHVDSIVVATDCDAIKNTVANFGFSKVSIYDREAANAGDTASTESVMLEYIEAASPDDGDTFMLVQATSPLTETRHFDEALERYRLTGVESLLSCVRMKRFFWSASGEPLNYDYRERPRRQDFDGILMENGALYINSVGNIKRDRNRLSAPVAVYEMPEHTAVEIDEEDDWLVTEKLMRKYRIRAVEGMKRIKLFLSDVDGVMTDAGMYYGESGEELKKFNTHDGKGFELLRNAGIKTGMVTSENTRIVENRAKKLKVDYLYQGKEFGGKLEAAREICKRENITLDEVAYIGDDINCAELLSRVGIAACPKDALEVIRRMDGMIVLGKKGGRGAVREFAELILSQQHAESD
jgi:N-acylneuraminate cytidylyltransferase